VGELGEHIDFAVQIAGLVRIATSVEDLFRGDFQAPQIAFEDLAPAYMKRWTYKKTTNERCFLKLKRTKHL
jgi:hypothetical protein